MLTGPVGCGSTSGSAPSRNAPIRAVSPATTSPGSLPGSLTAHTVRRVSPSTRWRTSSGRTIRAGGNEAQWASRAPSGSKAKPPTQTGPAPAGRSAGSSAPRRRATEAQAETTSRKRRGPLETTSWALPSPATAKPSRSGCSQQNQRSSARRDANTAAVGSGRSTAIVALTRRRGAPASVSSDSSEASACAASTNAFLLVGPGAADGDLAGARHLDQPVRADHPLERVDLLRRARDLDRQRAARDVDDLPLEDLGELHDVAAVLHGSLDPEQRHLPGDRLIGLHVADLHHVHQLVELLGDLIDRVDGAVQGQGDPRDVGVLRRADGEGVDVEAAAGEEPGDPGEDSGLVLDEERQDVLAAGERPADLQVLELDQIRGARLHQPTMSLAAAPAGIIGKQFSVWST